MTDKSFTFGTNWQKYIAEHFNDTRIKEAQMSFTSFCEGYDLKNKTFIDIGCGSGLFSLAAYNLGVKHLTSFDLDPDSVKCTRYLHERAGSPSNWEIQPGSILDDLLVSKLPKYDMVYSFGVLHHTGSMWKAIENALSLVADNGLFYIGIYNKLDCFGIDQDLRILPAKFWEIEKKYASRLPAFIQKFMEYGVMGFLILAYCALLKNPIKVIKKFDTTRGMAWRIDIRDWLFGYPFECASVDEIFHFVRKKGFSLENLTSSSTLRNNFFLFKKK